MRRRRRVITSSTFSLFHLSLSVPTRYSTTRTVRVVEGEVVVVVEKGQDDIIKRQHYYSTTISPKGEAVVIGIKVHVTSCTMPKMLPTM